MLKNYIMEKLKKIGSADRKFKCLSVTHDMTKKECEQCKLLVEPAKLKQEQEGQGEYIFWVRHLPSQMKIMKFRKREGTELYLKKGRN